MKLVPFSEIEEAIKELLQVDSKQRLKLIPEDILKLAVSLNFKVDKVSFEWWYDYEYGKKELEDEFIIRELFADCKPGNGKVLAVTDECFQEQLGCGFNFMDLPKFIDEYEEHFDVGFFQPLDIIFALPDNRLITILHHEGYRIQVRG